MSVLVGKKAPEFTAAAILGNGAIKENFNLYEEIKGQKAVLFFYPLNFTFVCPSEIIAFNNKIEEFKALNTKLIGVSIDSHFSHLAWKNTPVNKGGIGEIKFDLVSDVAGDIVKEYGIRHDIGVAYRASFLIDEEQNIRHQVVNDLPLGRSTDEMLRMIKALNHHQQHGEVCPANWNQDKEAMQATPEGVASYLAEHSNKL